MTTPGEKTSLATRTDDAASTVLRALEATWEAIITRHPEIPPVVVILASGTETKHAKWGHHAAKRWRVRDEDRAEVMVSGEGLRRCAAVISA